MTEDSQTPSTRLRGRLDLDEMLTKVPDPIDFVIAGLAAGTVGVFAAPGASGKSWWALEAAAAIAAADVPSSDLMGLGNLKSGRVVILSAEDPKEAIWHRVYAIGQRIKSPAALALIKAHLSIIPLVGAGVDLTTPEWCEAVIAEMQSIRDVRLVIIDTARRVHLLDENDTKAMANFIGKIESIAAKTGAAMLVIHHTSKASVLSGQGDTMQAVRGSTTLVDNARFVSFLQRMTKDEATSFGIEETEERKKFVRYGVSKASYSRLLEDVWLEQGDDGVLVPANLGVKKRPAKTVKKTAANGGRDV